MKKLAMTLVGTALSLLAGCGAPELTAAALAEAADQTVAVLTASCSQAASLRPQYRARNGTSLQGLSGSSVIVKGARLGCEPVEQLTLDKTTLAGRAGGRIVRGLDFSGSVLAAVDDQGGSSEIAITAIEADAGDPSGETLLYTLVALDSTRTATRNLCLPDAEGRSVAIPFSGRWDASGAHLEDGSISFHCTSGAVAKCARHGYRPWQSYGGQPLAAHHQACTRLLRGDYCGDGVSQTKDGTEIDLYDSLRFRTVDPSLLMTFEASWSQRGAYCIARERWLIVSSLLSPVCRNQFMLSIQSSPILPLDLCFAVRTGASPSEALLSNRTTINLGL